MLSRQNRILEAGRNVGDCSGRYSEKGNGSSMSDENTFTTKCPNCGEIEMEIEIYAHDEFSYEEECPECHTALPDAWKGALDAVGDWFGGLVDDAMNHYERPT